MLTFCQTEPCVILNAKGGYWWGVANIYIYIYMSFICRSLLSLSLSKHRTVTSCCNEVAVCLGCVKKVQGQARRAQLAKYCRVYANARSLARESRLGRDTELKTAKPIVHDHPLRSCTIPVSRKERISMHQRWSGDMAHHGTVLDQLAPFRLLPLQSATSQNAVT